MRPYIQALTMLLCGAFLAACSTVPRGAPLQVEIISQAESSDAEFAVYPVTRAFLPTVREWPVIGEPEMSWPRRDPGPSNNVILAGDRLNLRIWDSGDNSLLTAPEQRTVDIPNMRVSTAGTIFVPYVGDVAVTGLTMDRARAMIQAEMEAIVPSAQVQLAVAEGPDNSVDLVGGVATPGTYPLPDPNHTVLSLIASSGGVRPEIRNPQIRLSRNGRIFGTSVERLLEDPQLDTRLKGGDKIVVEEDRRYFLTIGSASVQSLHPFTKDRISAMDAIAITGGVNAVRADPQGILILREYPPSATEPGRRGPRAERVVFTLDLTDTDGLFSARNFDVRSGDVVLATESPVTSLRTVLGIVGQAFGIFNAIPVE